MTISRLEMLRLYKNLVREASKFPIYNYRMYALRRIRDNFKENSVLNDKEAIASCYSYGLKSLEVIKRQVVVSSLYKPEKLVIE